jgi:alpha-galactosidase
MKIAVKLPKPRNPLVAPTRSRKAGAHASHNPARQLRRVAKHNLRLMLTGRKTEGDLDA